MSKTDKLKKDFQKVIMAIISTFSMYLLPLVFSGNFMYVINEANIKLLVLSIFSIAIFLTQPVIEFSSAAENKKYDGQSMTLILLVSFLSQLGATLEYVYLGNMVTGNFMFTLVGFILILTGYSFRIKAIAELSKNFTAVIGIITKENLVTTGTYETVRHPSYLGAYFAMLGGNLLLESYYSLVFTGITLFGVYAYRIKLEEKMLLTFYKDAYIDYQKKTKWKLLPFIF